MQFIASDFLEKKNQLGMKLYSVLHYCYKYSIVYKRPAIQSCQGVKKKLMWDFCEFKVSLSESFMYVSFVY